jgi:hypothetical protein
MWYEIDLEVLKAKMKMKGLYYPSMLEVMTDGLKAFIWAEWDEQQKRYEFEHFNPGFRMGEWSEEFSVFGVNNHDRTDEITLRMINQGEIFSFGTCTECKFPKTKNVFAEFIPDQISRRYSVLGSDGKIYDTLTLSENGERQRFLCSADGDGGDLIKFEDFTGEFCRMARSEYIYVNTEV